MTDVPRTRHPALAATLSFLFPGLGQAYAGQRRLAALLAAPVVLLAVAALLSVALFDRTLRNALFSNAFLAILLALNLALMCWRLFAIGQAGLTRPPVRTAIGVVVLLAAATVAMHAYAGILITRFDAALDRIFTGPPVTRPLPSAPVAASPGESAAPIRPEYRWDGTEPINFLLLGVDAAPGREQALTDTILVVSIDPVAHDAVMISVPRDTGYLPLPDTRLFWDGRFPSKINELASDARADPELWCPGLEAGADCGVLTLGESVGLYLGIQIHYYAAVDLGGFARLIDAVGGVELCLPGELSDPLYLDPDSGERGIILPTGCHRYDGARALAYARIRQGSMEMPDGTIVPQNDFLRAERQQEVLLGLRRELAATDLFFELPGLLDAIGRTVTSDFPRAQAGDLASLIPLIAAPDIERVVLGLPDFVDPPLDPETNYLLIPRREAIRAEAERIFGDRGPLRGWYLGSDAPLPPPPDQGSAGSESLP